MIGARIHRARAVLVASILVLSACGSKEVLPERSAEVPAGIDLGGRWQLQARSNDSNRRLADAEVSAAGGREALLDLPRNGRPDRKDGAQVHVFLETGKNLKITQTNDGLFISFDRAIVEEYRFGEYREVRVGPVTAARSSGWEQAAYVIETLDRNGSKLFERYRLEDDGSTLLREISISKKDERILYETQRFDRVGKL